jgi:hypothetical protein
MRLLLKNLTMLMALVIFISRPAGANPPQITADPNARSRVNFAQLSDNQLKMALGGNGFCYSDDGQCGPLTSPGATCFDFGASNPASSCAGDTYTLVIGPLETYSCHSCTFLNPWCNCTTTAVPCTWWYDIHCFGYFPCTGGANDPQSCGNSGDGFYCMQGAVGLVPSPVATSVLKRTLQQTVCN